MIFMRTVWRDMLTITNTAGMTGIIFQWRFTDANASVIIFLATFFIMLLLYLTLFVRHKKSTRRY
jgi:hypothetical protein